MNTKRNLPSPHRGGGAGGEGVTRLGSTGKLPKVPRAGRLNLLQHIPERVIDFGVGEAQDADAFRLQKPLPPLVVGRLLGLVVDRPIAFDADPCDGAIEIEDEAPDRLLTTKAQPTELPSAQMLPKNLLGGRRVGAHRPGAVAQGSPPDSLVACSHRGRFRRPRVCLLPYELCPNDKLGGPLSPSPSPAVEGGER